MLILPIVVSIFLVIGQVSSDTDLLTGQTFRSLGKKTVLWLLYKETLRHQNNWYMAINMIAFWAETYCYYKCMAKKATKFIILLMIIAPIYAKITVFAYQNTLSSLGFSAIIFAMAGGLLSLMQVQWKKLTIFQKTLLLIFHTVFASYVVTLLFFRDSPASVYISSYLAGLVVVWGFYKPTRLRFFVAIALLVVYILAHWTFIVSSSSQSVQIPHHEIQPRH